MAKLLARLRDKSGLLKLHLKHYHMSPANFRRRTSMLKLPGDIYRSYDDVVKGCDHCQRYKQAPQRSKTTGIRAVNLGDLTFTDHVDITFDGCACCALAATDASSNVLLRRSLP